MKEVKIEAMTLHYFKGIKNQTVTFGDQTTTISGPNGSGKSTLMDAFCWCLWGKNSAGRSDFLVKTVDKDGVEIPHVDHEVKLKLTVGGQAVTLERKLVPEYDRKDNLKGNHTEYTWNDVPLKKGEYDAKVGEIIGEEVFKLIATPTAFLNMDWQKQRATLLKIAGKVDDYDVCTQLDKGTEGDYHDLLQQLSGKSIEEYKRELDSKLKKVSEQMTQLPARIDEVTRNTPEAPDTEAIRQQRQQLEEQLAAIESQEHDDAKQYEARNADRTLLLEAIDGLKLRRMRIINEAEGKARTAIHESNQTYIKAEAEYKALKAENDIDLQSTNNKQSLMQGYIATSRKNSDAMKQQLDALREDWRKENGLQFTASEYLTCPLYGHQCCDTQACSRYDQDQQGAFTAFVSKKKANLDSINARGAKMSAQIKELLGTIDTQLAELETIGRDYDGRYKQRMERLVVLQQTMTEHPKRPLIVNIDPLTLPGVKETDMEIASFEEQLSHMTVAEPVTTDNSQAKRQIREQLEALSKEEGKQQQIEAAEKRIEQLQQELTELGAQKAELEQQKRLTLDFEVARMNAVSEKVNQMFTLVRWQMFQRQVNGEEVPACICLVDGVRWQDANTAARMNAGIDVAAVLANAAKSFAPMFIDNAESNGSIYVPKGMPIQQIRLKFDPAATRLTITK